MQLYGSFSKKVLFHHTQTIFPKCLLLWQIQHLHGFLKIKQRIRLLYYRPSSLIMYLKNELYTIVYRGSERTDEPPRQDCKKALEYRRQYASCRATRAVNRTFIAGVYIFMDHVLPDEVLFKSNSN